MGAVPGPPLYGQGAEGEHVVSIMDSLRVLWKRLWIIISVMVVLTGAAVGFSLLQTPIYQASIMILVGQGSGVAENPERVGALEQVTKTMTEGVESRPVAEAVIRELGLEIGQGDFLNNLTAQQIPDTQFIQVNYTDTSPERASQVANTTGEVFSDAVAEVTPENQVLTATVWERAVVPSEPVSPQPVRNALVALVLGLILGTALAFLLEYLDDRWRSPEEAEEISGVPTFGVIPEFKALTGGKRGGN
jgi:capsular polysaccharide biosynthesis protein